MSNALKQFLELDIFISDNYEDMTQEELDMYIKKLEELKDVMEGE